MKIGVDFDNTIVLDEWPEVGAILPGAIETLRELQEAGHDLILYTQRTDMYRIYCPELEEYKKRHGDILGAVDLVGPAVRLLENHGIKLYAVNENPEWELEKQDYGRKVYLDLLIDDHNAGMKYKILTNSMGEKCKTVDWGWMRKWLKEEGIL